MHRIKIWLRHYFGFTTRESNGFIVLMAILFLILSLPSIYNSLQPDPEPIEARLEIIKADSILPVIQHENRKFNTAILFEFDPNIISESDLIKLGLKEFLAKRIINYRNKGGKFRKKEDFAKMYGLSTEMYGKLSPYIVINSVQTDKKEAKAEFKKFEKYSPVVHKIIEINNADTADLQKVNGIGQVLAHRIIKYRNKLGGFAKQEQLYEVYGLDSNVVQKLLKSFTLTDGNVKKLEINSLPADSLYQHPYIGRKAAKILVNYRLHHGNFKSANDLINSKALDSDKLNKLLPYLEF